MATVYTLGHSNLPWEKFTNLLKEYCIELVVDVRRFPTS